VVATKDLTFSPGLDLGLGRWDSDGRHHSCHVVVLRAAARARRRSVHVR
jgi:hypothetical protein